MELEKAIDFINNFDSKKVSVAFLFSIGRGGSILLHSFLDSHTQIITIPRIFNIYNEFKNLEIEKNNAKIISEKIASSRYFYEDIGYNFEYGKNIGTDFSFPHMEYLDNLQKLLSQIKVLNRKNIILASQVAYAIVKKQDLDNIKAIFIHEHFLNKFEIEKNFPTNLAENIIGSVFEDNDIFSSILNDFSYAKFIFTTRDFIPSFNSLYQMCKYKFRYPDFYNFIRNTLFLSKQQHDFEKIAQKYPENIYEVKFFDLHRKTKEVMSSLASFLNVDFQNNMLESTFDNKKLWYGDRSGANPDIEDNTSKYSISADFIEYAKELDIEKKDSFYKDNWIEEEFLAFISFIMNIFYSETFFSLVDYLPTLRRNIFSFAEKGNLEIFELNNTIKFKDIEFVLLSKYSKNSIPDNSYFIQIFDTTKFILENNIVNALNNKPDQIWVNSNFTKDILINNNVLENKIKVIPPQIDNSYYNFENIKDNSSKLKFICDFDEHNDLELILDILKPLYEKYNNFEISFFVQKEQDKKKLESLLSKSFVKEANILSYSRLVKKESFDFGNFYLYISKDNFAHINMLKGMFCGCIPVTNALSFAYDFCNNKNAIITNYKIEDNKVINDSKDISEKLEKIIKNYSFSILREKRVNIKNNMNKWNNYFEEKVYLNLNQLKELPVLRNNLDTIISDKIQEAKKLFEKEKFLEAKKLLSAYWYEDKYENLLLMAKINKEVNLEDELEDNLYKIIDNYGINEEIKHNFSKFLGE